MRLFTGGVAHVAGVVEQDLFGSSTLQMDSNRCPNGAAMR